MSDEEKNKGGRPTDYRVQFNKQAYHLALLGATDKDLAAAFDVSESAINAWKIAHPKFQKSIKAGKEKADGRVAKALFHRAVGYSHPAVKIVADAKTGAHVAVPYVERYPPDAVAGIFWLKNRRPDLWRDKQHVEHEGAVGVGVLAVPVQPQAEQWASLAAKQQSELMAPKAPLPS